MIGMGELKECIFEHHRQRVGESVRVILNDYHHVDILLTNIEKKGTDVKATFSVDTNACYNQSSYMDRIDLSYSDLSKKIDNGFSIALRGETNGNSVGVNYYLHKDAKISPLEKKI